MAGKYHRTYFAEDVQAAFDRMQKETGVASNAFVLKCVKEQLVAEGYLAKKAELYLPPGLKEKTEQPEVVGGTDEKSRRRSRVQRRRRGDQ